MSNSFLGSTEGGRMWRGWLVQTRLGGIGGFYWDNLLTHPECLPAALVTLWRARREFPNRMCRLVRA